MDLATNNAYPTPFANNPILPLLLLSLARQRHAPTTTASFREEYDYVIVGAGSAGSVLASRLSEVPCASVLLLEAGKAPPLLTEVPGLARNFWMTDLDWNYRTVPQKQAGKALIDNQVVWPSGKAVGGSSILNAQFYIRGNKLDYDGWARRGAVGWSHSDVFPYFLKLEDNAEPEFLRNGYHVVGGPMSVESPAYISDIKMPIFEAAQNLGYEFVDSNANLQTGFYDFQATVRGGQRCSTAKAYLVPAENRTNLDILANAFVRKIVIERGRATGVQFESGGRVHVVRSRREVVLSAGTTNTAQLLMLSGIGPKEHLRKMKIPVLADLPVGNNFHDHCGTPLSFELDPRLPSVAQKAADPQTATDYIQERKGLLASLEGISTLAFLSRFDKPLSPEFDMPDYQIYFVEVPKEVIKFQLGLKPKVYEDYFGPYENGTNYHCVVQLTSTKSRGTVRLNSTDPRDPPLIDPNYFHDPRDVANLVDGLKVCQQIASSPPLLKLGSRQYATPLPGCEGYADDEYLACFAKSLVLTFSHQVGTARMGHPNDPATVVDPRLRVKGIRGLRVVDASVMPVAPSGNTNVPTIMVAEKAADIIKETLDCKTQIPFGI